MKPALFSSAVAIAFLPVQALAAPPVVSNVRASQIAGTKNVEIFYDVSDADGDSLTIGMQVSGDAGQTYTIPTTALSGHIGAGIAPGAGRRIVWNAGADWNGQLVSQAKVRVTASDSTTPAPPPGMVYIPAGVFQMGDNFNEVGADALPVHNVFVSALFMDIYEVTKELWQAVQVWGQANGYQIAAGDTNTNGNPVGANWYDAVKWCNARSEKEGLTPCYYTDDTQTTVDRTGSVNVTNAQVKWTANGYRLPTEAEWEKAARGGVMGQRYPWGDVLDGGKANYTNSGDPFNGPTPVGYYNGSQTPAGTNMANGYGLYDMAGNVWEHCWDWYSSTFYGDSAASHDPHGPTSGTQRVIRGGSWYWLVGFLRCGARTKGDAPAYSGGDYGIRCVRNAP